MFIIVYETIPMKVETIKYLENDLNCLDAIINKFMRPSAMSMSLSLESTRFFGF